MRRRALGAAFVALLAAACASAAPSAPDARDLAGTWRGRMVTTRGHASASMTVKEDGTFTGTIYFDGLDRDFHGAIVAVRPGELRYMGSEGDGTVRLGRMADHSTVYFVGDDGATGARFNRQPAVPSDR